MHGEPIEFQFSSTDATSAAPLVVRRAGSFKAITLEDKERIVIEDLNFIIADAVDSTRIIADADEDGDADANESLFVMGPGADSYGTRRGMSGAQGVIPKVLASGAGSIEITGSGYITRS